MNFGAINKDTLNYELPCKAIKTHKYKCVDCDKDLILCKGNIKKAYFRHLPDKNLPCTYYTKPTESQIHKDAKFRLKDIIERKKNIKLNRYCNNCNKINQYNIPDLCNQSKILIEYKFTHNESNKSADLVYLKENKIINKNEIFHTNKTKDENRPEPWFEFNAQDIIDIYNKDEDNVELTCIRDKKCNNCYNMDELKEKNLEKWVRIKLGQNFDNYRDSKDHFDNYKHNKDHKRFKRDTDNNKHLLINKEISELFKDDLNSNRLIVYPYEGTITICIVSCSNYNDFEWDKDIDSKKKIPYLYKKIYEGDGSIENGTVYIIKDLIEKCKYIIPEIICKNTKKTRNTIINKYSKYWKNNTYEWRNYKVNEMQVIYYKSLFYILDNINKFKNNVNNTAISNKKFENIYSTEYYKALEDILNKGKNWQQWDSSNGYNTFDKNVMKKFIKTYNLTHPYTILKNCMTLDDY